MNPSKKTLIIIYLVFLVVFFWQSANKKAAPIPEPVRIIANSSSYTLPATPVVSLINDTKTDIIVDTCRDIGVTANGVQKTNLPEAFCRTVTATAQATTPLFGDSKEDIFQFQESFADIPEVNLRFTYTQFETTNTSETTLTIGHAGAFRLFFRTFFYNPVYNLFVALTLLLPGYSLGGAIVAITLIIRLGLLIPQQKMLVSQRRMQVIQPKIKAIQEEHKGDQATIGMKMMELYKKEGVNPLGSCLPILIQIPILIVLYQVILNISNPGNLAHLYDFDWLQNFRNITLNTNFFGLELKESGGIIGVVLGLTTGGLQFGQMWLAQKRIKSAQPEKEEKLKDPNMPDMQQMQKMMIYIFPAMAALFAYQFPAGVGLYWLIGTLFMIVQQYFANKTAEDKKMVIRDKAGNVIG
ncbi:membrane protein insertase YidC [Candidatus Gracilibacteria bacterium]|nr:membrane protein insertase YidC [Candidatus Gracilibacteria bacterium]